MHRNLFGLAASALFMALVAGCGSDRPDLGEVTGTVTIDGKPLTFGGIIFTPVDGGRQSSGTFDDSGRYELTYIRDIKGAKVGEHKVVIWTGNEEAGRAEILPPKYNEQTELTANVTGGDNVIPFDLTTK